MSARLCRLGTVFFQTCLWRIAKPSTWGVLLLMAFTAAGSISLAMFTPPFSQFAFGTTVSFGAKSPSLAMCGSGQVVYVGDPITLSKTESCGPLHLRIGIASPVTLDAPAPAPPPTNTAPHPATRRVSPVHSATTSKLGTANRTSPTSEVRSQIARVRQSTTRDVHNTAFDIWLALIVWSLMALICCLGSSLVIVTAINMVIKAANRLCNLAYLVAGLYPGANRRKFSIPELSQKLMRGVILVCGVLWIITAGQACLASASLTRDKTVPDVVGAKVIYLVPSPSGHVDTTDNAAVIGHSLAAVYGGDGSSGYCWRSDDSTANLLSQMPWPPGTPAWHFLNLACSGATIAHGLLGPQHVSDSPEITMPAQVGRLKQMPNLHLVVVYIGANDVGLPGQAKACIGMGSCNNNLSVADFQRRLTMFASNFAQLLQQLYALPSHPKVVVNLGYGAMSPSAAGTTCLSAIGLSAQSIQLLDTENQELNDVLIAGTAQFQKLWPNGFTTADPQLNQLCRPSGPEGPDIQPIWKSNGQPNPFALHPTDAGARIIAITDLEAILALESAGS
jgi:lysophospholipase L1-like esterase